MSYEYYIRPTIEEESGAFWRDMRERALVSSCFVREDGNALLLRAPDSSSDWEYDIRLFAPPQLLLEISSWNDTIRVAIGELLADLRRRYAFRIEDEDGVALNL